MALILYWPALLSPFVANAPLTATHVARWSVEWSGRAMTTVNRGAPR